MLSNTFSPILSLFFFSNHFLPSYAQQIIPCENARRTSESLNVYNSTTTLSLPALRINGTVIRGLPGPLVEDNGKSWQLTSRSSLISPNSNTSMQSWFLNTGDSNMTDIGACTQVFGAETLGTFSLPRYVLERGANDTGDCRTMLGSSCVDALHRHYQSESTPYMTRGTCRMPNTTIPQECRELIDGSENWLGGSLHTGVNFNHTYPTNCTNADWEPLNSSTHHFGGLGGNYHAATRFPTVQILMFWPNRTGSTVYETSWFDDVHVEIKCIKTDEFPEGSNATPTAKEILDGGLRYHTKLGDDAGNPGENDTSQAANLGMATWYFSLVGLVAMMVM